MNEHRDIANRTVVDLSVEYFPGMPYIPATPAFHYGLTREHGDHVLSDGVSSASDQVVMHLHSGTHIDAICHSAVHGKLFTGLDAKASQNKWHGFKVHSVETIEPIVRRGILLDVPRLLGLPALEPGTEIDSALLERTREAQGVEIRAGDVVLIRTGEIQRWPSRDYYDASKGGISGINLDAARYLSSRKVFLVGSDNYAIEHIPPPKNGARASAMPVHGHLIAGCGIFLLEVMNLEELSDRQVYEFGFIALPLRIRGATGSPVRPIALF
ncbi:MAG: cyclase family protein [Burkholderiaceae bacterium]